MRSTVIPAARAAASTRDAEPRRFPYAMLCNVCKPDAHGVGQARPRAEKAVEMLYRGAEP
jgi:hypothetical protein